MKFKFEDNSPACKKALDQAIKKFLVGSGELITSQAETLAPVDTGNLKTHIENKVVVSDKAVHIGTNVEYAPYVEFGTWKMREQPFLRPAFRYNKNNVTKLLEQYLREIG